MKSFAAVVWLVMAGLVFAADEEGQMTKEELIRRDYEGLTGTFRLVCGIVDGKPVTDEVRQKTILITDHDKFSVSTGEEAGTSASGTFTIDPTKMPKTVDSLQGSGPDALKNIPANIDPDGAISFARWDVALIDRDPDAGQQALDSCRGDPLTSSTGGPLTKSYLQAYIDLMRGNVARAQANFEAARPALEKIVNSSPQDFVRHAQLGLLYALIGRKADAVREGQRAVELKPAAIDAIDGPLAQTFLCLIYTRVGENDQAISLLGRIQQRPGYPDVGFDSTTLSDLRRRWEWDPLRNDPRFQKIIAGPEPKPVY